MGGASHPINWAGMSQVFIDENNSISRKFSIHEFNPSLRTEIGNDVWIGDRALIKSGVIISDGAVIGMGSVVTKSVDPYEIWAGNPARLIRKRFDDDTIIALLEIKWWDLNEEKLRKAAVHIDDVEAFIQYFNN